MNSSCFKKLISYLSNTGTNDVELSIREIEDIIESKLPDSSHNHSAWWYSSGPKDHPAVFLLQDSGWFAKPDSTKNIQKITFYKKNEIKAIASVHKKKKSVVKRNDIISPCPSEFIKYLEKWNNLGSYVIQEEALDDLYIKTYPKNTDIKQVIIKVSALNDFYSTNIFKVYPVAKHIIELNIDERISNNDVSLVNDIANVKVLEKSETTEEKYKNFYSFATKYCSRHNPTEFPIYDSYVEKLLRYFRDTEGRISFKNENLKDYAKYKSILQTFQEQYGLKDFNLKQIDKYLWQLGKEKFPKNYGKKK